MIITYLWTRGVLEPLSTFFEIVHCVAIDYMYACIVHANLCV